MYVDGEVVATGTAEAAITTDSSTMQFGKHSSIGYRAFSGLLDDIRIYESALSSTEVAALVSNESAAAGTILNDDSATVSINDASVVEGGNLEFNVSLSNPVDTDTVISYSTSDDTATASDSDYTGHTSQTVTIAAGETSGTITVATTVDNQVELDETLTVAVDAIDADGRNVLAAGSSMQAINFNDGQGEDVPIPGDHYAASGVTFTNAAWIGTNQLGVDAGVRSGSFFPGVTNPIVLDFDTVVSEVSIQGFGVGSNGAQLEVFDAQGNSLGVSNNVGSGFGVRNHPILKVSAPGIVRAELTQHAYNGSKDGMSWDNLSFVIQEVGTGTLLNDDSASVSIADASVAEGSDLEFEVTLSNPADVDTVITYSTADGSATTANGDYASQSNQSITIAAGQTSGVITITTGDDDLVELDETLTVSITEAEASGRDVSASATGLSTGGLQSVFANVPEAADYVLVYDLAIPDRSNFDSGPVPYSVDNSGLIPDGSFDRIAYYLELDNGSGLQYAYVSANAFTEIAAQTGVPVITTGATFEQNLNSMNVFSNVPGIVTGTDINTGNIEFWHQNYGRAADDGLPGASDSNYDFDDTLSLGFDSGYGSMQIHNYGAGQTIFGFNAWDWSGGGDDDLGIGNSPRTREPDWTYTANAGTYNIKNLQVLVRDSGVSATGTIINDDFAPEADAGGPYVINEGGGLALDASATTDADSTALTYRWDVDGDGDFDENVTGATPELTSAQMASLGLNDGPDSRTVTVEASDGTNTGMASTTLTINNVDPNFEAGNHETLLPPVAGSFSRSLNFTDPGADSWTGTVNFGDGSGDQALTINQATKSFDLSHVYTADGIFTVTVTVEDDDSGSHTDTFDVEVILNTPPVANNDSASTDEDSAVTFNVLSNDTDEQNNIIASLTTALTTPSEGTLTDNGNGSFTFDPSGAFESLAVGESAQVSFDYQIEDSFGETDTAAVTVTVHGVNDTPVVSNAGDVSVDEGQAAFNSGSWSDIDASDIITLSASQGTVTRNDDGTWSWSVAANDGPDESQTVVITAGDGHGGVTTSSFELTVNNVAPTVVSVSSTNADVENASGDGNVSVSGSFSDPGLDTHTVTVNWGDGTSEDVSVDQTADSFTGDHEYSSGGIYTVTVTVTDSDGAISTTETTSAVVEGAGVVDGTLFVIGTDGKDVIHVHEHWRRDRITVHAHLDIRHHGWWWHRRTTSTHVYQTFAAEDVDQIVVHARAGNDHVHVIGCFFGGITKDAVIFGGDGNDQLIGGRGNDVIVGGAGNDHMYGGHGRDILIGGSGRDKIDGGRHNDLLIAGSASNESDQASLDVALAAWIDGDLSAALLSLGAISDDAARDHLRGGRGTDELIGGARDKLKR